MLRQQQMAGGRNGKKLGDPLDYPKHYNSYPIRHEGKDEKNT
jgi:hypothetical protein